MSSKKCVENMEFKEKIGNDSTSIAEWDRNFYLNE